MSEVSHLASDINGKISVSPTPWRDVVPKASQSEPGKSSPDNDTTLSLAERRMLKHILRGELDYVEPSKDSPEQPGGEPPDAADELARQFVKGAETLDRLALSHQFDTRDRFTRRAAVVLLQQQSTSTLTIVFNGNQPLLAVPNALLRRNSHILMIRDPKRCFGLAGIPGLGATAEACVVRLKELAEDLGVKKIFCIGISAGGSSALKLGTDLKADGMLCFSSPTTLNIDDDPGAELGHYPQLTQLYRTDRSLGIDLAEHYRRATPRPGLLMVYGADHPRDSWLAERIANVRGAELLRIDDFDGHKTYPLVRHRGMMPDLLERMFNLKPVTESSSAN